MRTSVPWPAVAVGLGCYPLGGGYGYVDRQQAGETLAAALDAGWTFLDTSEAYLASEERLGELLAGKRDRVFLATKTWPCEPFTKGNLQAALDASLRRLRTDRIDLYQLHAPENWVLPGRYTPVEEIAAALDELRASGKFLRLGLCNFPVTDLAELHRLVGVSAIQDLYSVIDPGADDDHPYLPSVSRKLDYVRRNGIAFIAYSPLARGLLSDRLRPDPDYAPDDERHFLPRYQPGVYEHYVMLNSALADWARERGQTVARLAVAWVLGNPAVGTVLVGAKSASQVSQLAHVQEWTLSDAERAEVSALARDLLPPAARAALPNVMDHLTPSGWERIKRGRQVPP